MMGTLALTGGATVCTRPASIRALAAAKGALVAGDAEGGLAFVPVAPQAQEAES
jgi:hypothetical protein